MKAVMRYVDYSNMRYNGEQCGTAWDIYVTIMTTMPNVEAIIVSLQISSGSFEM